MVEGHRIYTPGGTVQAGQGVYLERQADAQLLQLCRQRNFAYVLTSRQMGKSSLMVHTARQLATEGIVPIIVDLTDVGVQNVTAESWYRGVLLEIENKLEQQGQFLETDVYEWWERHRQLTSTQRFAWFFRTVLLQEINVPIVVFIDEIDTTLSLNFTDDFFIAIRSFYTARAQVPTFQRLSFVLIGVATPGDLIIDARRTPFNIGQRVDLTDFTLDEAWPLRVGLGLPDAEAQQVLQWALRWTGGHPYLTQRLCIELARVDGQGWTRKAVDTVVHRTFLGARSEQDNNLQFVRDMLTTRSPDVLGVLATYKAIYRGKPPVRDEEQSLIKAHLKLSGVVKPKGKVLRVRNRIYHAVFNSRWIRDHWPLGWWAQVKPALPLVATSLLVAGVMTGLAISLGIARISASANAKEARSEKEKAELMQQMAEKAELDALAARDRAEEEAKNAKEKAEEAREAQLLAFKEQKKTKEALAAAEDSETRAQEQANLAKNRLKALLDFLEQREINLIELTLASLTSEIEDVWQECDTWLELGLRAIYCKIKPFAGYAQLSVISDLPIFIEGPHSDEKLNFKGGYEFGYYNPKFLEWLEKKIITNTEGAVTEQIQAAYNKELKVLARSFYQSHQVLFMPSGNFETFVSGNYKRQKKIHQERLNLGMTNMGYFYDQPLEFKDIKKRYSDAIRDKSIPENDIAFALQEDVRWLSDYLASRYENNYEDAREQEHYEYLANTSAGFWVRRSIDGTEQQFFDLLTKFLEIYDSEWLETQKTIDP